MSLLKFTGFESGGSTEENNALAGTSSIVSSGQRTGSYAFRSNPTTTATGSILVASIGADGLKANIATGTIVFGFAFKAVTKPASNEEPIARGDAGAGSFAWTVTVTSTGLLKAYTGNGTGGTLIGTSANAVGSGYEYIEVCSNNTNNTFKLKMNGKLEISGVSTNFTTDAVAGISLGKGVNSNGQTVDFYYDDVYVGDQETDLIARPSAYPEVKVLIPNGAGDSAGWTNGTGTTFAEVDEVPHDTDTTYIQASATQDNLYSVFAVEDTSTKSVDSHIVAIQGYVVAKTASTTGTSLVGLRVRSNGVNSDTTNIELTTGYVALGKVLTTNPATSQPWTTSGVDAVQIGMVAGTIAQTQRFTQALVFVMSIPSTPTVRAVGQYRNDETTVIPVGGSSPDGVTDNVSLVAEVAAGHGQFADTGKSETEIVGTAFDDVSNGTGRELRQDMPVNDATSSRRGGGMVYDDVNKRYIYFGGYDGTTRYNDVWEKYTDTPNSPWRKLYPTGTPPSGRNIVPCTFVKGNLTSGGALRAYMIIWGGSDPNDKNDMFSLRLDTPGSEAWTTITQTSAPSARSYSRITSAPVSGASDQIHIYQFGGWISARLNDMNRCVFDVDTPTAVTWTNQTADGAGGSPSRRSGMLIDYKASTNKIYMYGGYDGSTMLSDFWEYNCSSPGWTNTSPTGSAFTGSEEMAGGYDVTNNRFWVTGGWTTNGTFSTNRNNIGYINDVGGSESYVEVRANTTNTNDQSFPGHSFAAFCVDTDKQLLVLKGMATVDSTERYGYLIDFNDGITSGKPAYGMNDGDYLTPRDAPASVYDPDGSEWLVIGGFGHMSDQRTIATGTHLNDVWAYNSGTNTWRYANKGFKGLPPMEGRIAAYDTNRNRVILFGGLTGVAATCNEVWSLTRDSIGNYEAAKLQPTGTPPSDRWVSIIAYDDVLDRIIVALGGDSAGPTAGVYSLSFSGGADGAWTTLSPTGSVTSVAYASFWNKDSNQRLYVYGGATNSALTTISTQMVYLDYSTTNGVWNAVTNSGGTAVRGAGFDFDVSNDRLLLTGGFDGTNPTQLTQAYNLSSGTTWSTVTPVNAPWPRRSLAGCMIGSDFYSFGGRPNSGVWYNDTNAFTPNYGTFANSTWAYKNPPAYTPMVFKKTGLTNNSNYHWQVWSSE